MIDLRAAVLTVLLPVAAFASPAAAQTAAAPVPAVNPAAQPVSQPAPAPTFAPSVPTLRLGTPVAGPGGLPVGSVVLVENGVAIIDTGRYRVPLPLGSFGYGPTGATLPVTQLQLNALVEAQLAAARAARDAALVVGTPVQTADGQALGTVQSVEGDRITVLRPGGARRVLFLRDHLEARAGGLVSQQTLAEIDTRISAAIAAEQAAAAAAAAANTDAQAARN